MNAYPFTMPIATRWIDNDVYGHVNNVVYYAYFDTIINRYLIAEVGLDIEHGEVIGVCAESQCTYLRSAAFPDALDAGLRVAKIGTTSVTYELAILRGTEVCATGRFVHVFVDRKTRTKTPIPSAIRAALERLTSSGA